MAHIAYELLTKALRRLEESEGHEEELHADEEHHGEDDHADGSALLGAKIGLIFGIGAITLAASLIPWCAKRTIRGSTDTVLHFFGAAAAGIIFGALMTIIIPEASELYSAYFVEKAIEHPDEAVPESMSSYPWSTLTVTISFSFLLVLEALILGRGKGHGHGHGHSHGHEGKEGAKVATENAATHQHMHNHACASVEVATVAATALGMSTGLDGEGEGEGEGKGKQDKDDASTDSRVSINDPTAPTTSETAPALTMRTPDADAHTALHAHSAHPPLKSIAKAWVFFLALSAHSFLDGLAVGTVTDSATFAAVLTAVLVHKPFDGLALGAQVSLSGMPWKTALAALGLCACMTPIGIAVGIGAAEGATEGHNADLASAVVLGLSGGSYLYACLTELLPTALADGKHRGPKLVLFMLGWLSMALLAGYGAEGHAHGGEHAEEAH